MDPISAVLSGGGALAGFFSSLFGGNDDSEDILKAAEIKAQMAREVAGLQRRTGLEGVMRQAPYTSGGYNALIAYLDLLGLPRPTIEQLMAGEPLPTPGNEGERLAWDRKVKEWENLLATPKYDPTQLLESTPGYKYRVGESENALNRYLASKGMSLSGPGLKAAEANRQGLASQEYNALLNRIQGVTSQGQNAAAGASNINMQGATGAGQALMAGAGAQAEGIYNSINARNSSYGNPWPWLGYGAGTLYPAIKNWYTSSSFGGGGKGENG